MKSSCLMPILSMLAMVVSIGLSASSWSDVRTVKRRVLAGYESLQDEFDSKFWITPEDWRTFSETLSCRTSFHGGGEIRYALMSNSNLYDTLWVILWFREKPANERICEILASGHLESLALRTLRFDEGKSGGIGDPSGTTLTTKNLERLGIRSEVLFDVLDHATGTFEMFDAAVTSGVASLTDGQGGVFYVCSMERRAYRQALAANGAALMERYDSGVLKLASRVYLFKLFKLLERVRRSSIDSARALQHLRQTYHDLYRSESGVAGIVYLNRDGKNSGTGGAELSSLCYVSCLAWLKYLDVRDVPESVREELSRLKSVFRADFLRLSHELPSSFRFRIYEKLVQLGDESLCEAYEKMKNP